MDATFWETEGARDARHDWRYRNSKLHQRNPWLSRYRLHENAPLFKNDPPRWDAYDRGYQAEWARKRAEDQAARPA